MAPAGQRHRTGPASEELTETPKAGGLCRLPANRRQVLRTGHLVSEELELGHQCGQDFTGSAEKSIRFFPL